MTSPLPKQLSSYPNSGGTNKILGVVLLFKVIVDLPCLHNAFLGIAAYVLHLDIIITEICVFYT